VPFDREAEVGVPLERQLEESGVRVTSSRPKSIVVLQRWLLAKKVGSGSLSRASENRVRVPFDREAEVSVPLDRQREESGVRVTSSRSKSIMVLQRWLLAHPGGHE